MGTPAFMAPGTGHGASRWTPAATCSAWAASSTAWPRAATPSRGRTPSASCWPSPPWSRRRRPRRTRTPPALADLIVQLLAKDPGGRPTPREVADRIAAVEEAGQATEALPVSGRSRDPARQDGGDAARSWRGRSLVAVFLGLLLLGALAVVAWRYAPQLAGRFTGPTAPNGGPPPAADKAGDPLTGVALVGRPAPLPAVHGWTVETRGHRGSVPRRGVQPGRPGAGHRRRRRLRAIVGPGKRQAAPHPAGS